MTPSESRRSVTTAPNAECGPRSKLYICRRRVGPYIGRGGDDGSCSSDSVIRASMNCTRHSWWLEVRCYERSRICHSKGTPVGRKLPSAMRAEGTGDRNIHLLPYSCAEALAFGSACTGRRTAVARSHRENTGIRRRKVYDRDSAGTWVLRRRRETTVRWNKGGPTTTHCGLRTDYT